MDIRNNNLTEQAETSISRIEELETRQHFSATNADIGINVNDASTTAFQKAVPVMKQMGITSVRLYLGIDSYTSRSFAGVLQRAIDYHNAGFDVMVVVNGNTNAVPNPSDVKGWFQWAMSNNSLKTAVDRWEIGNEVDSSGYFGGSLSQYVDTMLKPAYQVLHAAGEKVVSAGVSWNPQDVKTMIGYGLLDNCDYVGFHPYANGVAEQASHIKELQQIVAGRRPLVASEWNVRGLENDKSAWAQAVHDAYKQVKDAFAFNYYFCLFVQNTPAGPGAIMNKDGSQNTLFWNAVSSFKSQAAGSSGSTISNGSTTAGGNTATNTSGNTAAAGNGSISGVLWNDDDADSKQDFGETLTGVRTVFIDANGNGQLDSGERTTQSDSNGRYTFSGLSAGTYNISRQFPSGYRMSTSSTNDLSVTLNPGQTISDANIGTTVKPRSISGNVISSAPVISPVVSPVTSNGFGTISGTLWNDTDGDGYRDSGESVTGVRTVFIDANGNGKLDSGERTTQSDSNGAYSFTGLSAGWYNISRVFPSGYHLSNHATDVSTWLNAGQTISGLNIGSTTV